MSRSDPGVPRRLRAAALLGLALTWGGTARATPDFPAVVVKALGLPGITVDPPQGCTLCHSTDSGGTSLRSFGTLLQQYGVQPYEESTVGPALAQVQQSDPQLIDDIKAGRDPNDDTGSANVHSPEYGCVASRARGSRGVAWVAALGLFCAVLGLRRSRARTRPPRPS
jgi:hypothetical protein